MTGAADSGRLPPVGTQAILYGKRVDSEPLPWSWAEERLIAARNYWIATTRPDGRPHCRPVWGNWLDWRLYFSTGSLAVGNLERNPEISVNLESGNVAVIVEGTASVVDDRATLLHVIDAYNAKYNWDVDPDNIPGNYYAVQPRIVLGWTLNLFGTATRWRLRP